MRSVFLLTIAASAAACIVGAATAADRSLRDAASPPTHTNAWAVQVEGGPSAADALAAKYGFINRRQVSSGNPPTAPVGGVRNKSLVVLCYRKPAT